ncbi:MAG: DUF3667 domain-containing protein [Alphaproteobacteria bacterium]|nr:DUF3667 domain-containing protein [Alphaproteobacteria bacterium]
MEELEAALETGGAAAAELAVSALLQDGGRVVPCPNCASPVIGRYCAQCGQPTETHRRSVVHLVQDFVKDIASFDSRILRTTRALLFRPGELALAFRQGRTQRYVPAVRLYLFVSLIFFLTLSATHIAIVQFVPVVTPEKIFVENGKVYAIAPGEEKIRVPAVLNDGRQHFAVSADTALFFAREGTVHPSMTAAARADIDNRLAYAQAHADDSRAAWISAQARRTAKDLATNPAALNGALTAWIPRALFLLLPLFALLLAAFYWRSRRRFYFVDHLVFSLGFHAFAFALLLVAAGLAQILPGEMVAWATLAALGAYLVLAMRRFYAQSWAWTGVKFLSVAALYTVFCVFPAMIGIFLASIFYG